MAPPAPTKLIDIANIDPSLNTQEQIDAYYRILGDFDGTIEGQFLASLYDSGPHKGKGQQPNVQYDFSSDSSESTHFGWGGFTFPELGDPQLNINWTQLATEDYANMLSPTQYSDFSLERALFHEMFHGVASEFYYDGKDFWPAVIASREDVTTALTNHYMAKYYGEPARSRADLFDLTAPDPTVIQRGSPSGPVATSVYALAEFEPTALDVGNDPQNGQIDVTLEYAKPGSNETFTQFFQDLTNSYHLLNDMYESIIFTYTKPGDGIEPSEIAHYMIDSSVFSLTDEAALKGQYDLSASWVAYGGYDGFTVETRVNDGVTLESPVLKPQNDLKNWFLIGGAGDDTLVAKADALGEQVAMVGGPGLDIFDMAPDGGLAGESFTILDGFGDGILKYQGDTLSGGSAEFIRDGELAGYFGANGERYERLHHPTTGADQLHIKFLPYGSTIGLQNYATGGAGLSFPSPIETWSYVSSGLSAGWANPGGALTGVSGINGSSVPTPPPNQYQLVWHAEPAGESESWWEGYANTMVVAADPADPDMFVVRATLIDGDYMFA